MSNMSDEYDNYSSVFNLSDFNRINPYEIDKKSLGNEENLFERITNSKSHRKIKSIKKTPSKKNR